jgi:hypothetical protein
MNPEEQRRSAELLAVLLRTQPDGLDIPEHILAEIGLAVDTVQFADWLTAHGLRMRFRRKGNVHVIVRLI